MGNTDSIDVALAREVYDSLLRLQSFVNVMDASDHPHPALNDAAFVLRHLVAEGYQQADQLLIELTRGKVLS